ncbi:MAG: N-acetyltransferase family protein [Planctomycetota bacterium]
MPAGRSWLLKEILGRWGSVAEHHLPEAYPRELEEGFEGRDGRRARVRPIRPEDVPLLREGFRSLSPLTIYRRFHAQLDHLSDEACRYLTHVDYRAHLALVALDEASGRMVGVARYYLPAGAELAEAAVVITDAWQGQGLGSFLLRRLSVAAEARGVAGFEAFIQPDNLPMRRMVERSGYLLHGSEAPDAVHVWFRFAEL